MDLSCGCLICCYLFCLLLFSPIIVHLFMLCHFNSGEVDSWCWIRVPPGDGVLILQFYLPLLKYHHKSSLHLLYREDSLISHFVIRCRSEKSDYLLLLNTTLCWDDQNRFVGIFRKQPNRCKCVLWNLIYAFWRFLDGGYICLCICYHVG